jgi:hypothetical protein
MALTVATHRRRSDRTVHVAFWRDQAVTDADSNISSVVDADSVVGIVIVVLHAAGPRLRWFRTATPWREPFGFISEYSEISAIIVIIAGVVDRNDQTAQRNARRGLDYARAVRQKAGGAAHARMMHRNARIWSSMWSLLHVVAMDGRSTDFQARKREGGMGGGRWMHWMHACMHTGCIDLTMLAGHSTVLLTWSIMESDLCGSVRWVCTDEKIPGR